MNYIQGDQNDSDYGQKKKRVKKYNHIDNNTRKKLLELVKVKFKAVLFERL